MARQSNKNKKKSNAAPANPSAASANDSPTRSPHSQISLPPRGAQQLIISSILFIAVLAVFWPCVHNDFINLDDDLYIVGNAHVQHGFSRWNPSVGPLLPLKRQFGTR